jgi:multidrug resistance protein
MQSFLAYRRFGRHVRAQFDRDRQKAEVLNHINANTTESPSESEPGHRPSSIDSLPSSTLHVPSPDIEDVEKGCQLEGDTAQEGELPDGEERAGLEGNMKRIRTGESLATMRTQDSFGTRMGNVLSGVEVRTLTKQMSKTRSRRVGKQRTNGSQEEKPEGRERVFVVSYESEKDNMNPHNWSYTTRIGATILIAAIGWIVGFASSIDSAAQTQAAAEFGVSDVAESLATGLFLIGFGFGALFAGPISETVGRNPVYIVTLFIYMIWILASALAPNLGAQLVFRFLAGFFGSTPLTCAGGSISDLWDPMERVFAFPVFANAAFMGPIFGPVVGGFIGQSSRVSWRWTEWITLILSSLILVLVVLFQPETYTPILLKWKAHHLRELTGDNRYVAEVEIRADDFTTRLRIALYRPFLLAFREPIIMLFALYLTVIYIVLFTFLDGYTFIFTDTYGFSQGITGLTFIGIGIGLCFASLWVPLIYAWAKRDLAAVQAQGGDRLPPEKRLWFAMFGAPAVPISLFWMGWTTCPEISYWSPLGASVLFGYGILCIFISTYQYIIDSYEIYAASALASLTLIRYVAAGGMVVAGIP